MLLNKYSNNSTYLLKSRTKKRNIFLLIGDYITLGIKIQEDDKIRLQEYSGIIIAKKNTNFNSTIVICCSYQNITIEYCFLLNSSDILFIKILYSINLTRSKLYYLRTITQKKL